MNDEKITFKTKQGYEITIRKFLTGGDRQAINAILLDGLKDGEKIDVDNISFNKKIRLQNETLKRYVQEIKDENGKKIEGDSLEIILGIHEDVFTEVNIKINDILVAEKKN